MQITNLDQAMVLRTYIVIHYQPSFIPGGCCDP